MNTICHNCGNGSGTYPCHCSPKIEYIPMKIETLKTTDISNYADNYIIEPLREKSFNEIMEEVLEDRAEAWEILANG